MSEDLRWSQRVSKGLKGSKSLQPLQNHYPPRSQVLARLKGSQKVFVKGSQKFSGLKSLKESERVSMSLKESKKGLKGASKGFKKSITITHQFL